MAGVYSYVIDSFVFINKEVLIVDNNVDKAREKLMQEKLTAGSAQDRVREILFLWLEASPDEAADLILAKDKTAGRAYTAMREKASKNRGSASCVCTPPEEAVGTILEYFGMKDVQQKLEHGLLYKMMMAASKKFRPYGMTESAIENPHPVAEAETKAEAEIEAPLHRVDLSAFTMEGLL